MRPSSPAMMLAMFVLGACTTVAVQSSASVEPAPASAPGGDAPADSSSPTVVPLAEAPSATSPNGKATVTHLARGRNAYLGMLQMQPGAAVPTHRDPTEEFIHVLEGSGTMIIDGQSYAVAAGTTIYMPAEAEVSYQNGEQPMRAIQVFAGPEPSAKYDGWEPN